jgi:hypothetical protein
MPDLKRNRNAARNAEPERPVLICVISRADSLAVSCRECFETILTSAFRVEQHRSATVYDGYHIYLWDRETVPVVPPALTERGSSAKIIVANNTSLSLRREVGHEEFTLLRNPISMRSLKAVVSRALHSEILKQPFETTRALHEYQPDRHNRAARFAHYPSIPLTTVRGYCGLLLDGQSGSPTVSENFGSRWKQ